MLPFMSGDALFFFSLEILTPFILFVSGLVDVGDSGSRGVVSGGFSSSSDGVAAGVVVLIWPHKVL